jgi:hypothetical protein
MPKALSVDDVVNKANPLITWKIYYHAPDAPNYYSTFSNLDGRAEDAPVYGVIVIQQPIENGRGIDRVVGADYYAIDEEGKWVGMDDKGLEDRRINNLPYSALKEGRWINTDRFWDILYLSSDDKDFVYNPKGRVSRLPVVSLSSVTPR